MAWGVSGMGGVYSRGCSVFHSGRQLDGLDRLVAGDRLAGNGFFLEPLVAHCEQLTAWLLPRDHWMGRRGGQTVPAARYPRSIPAVTKIGYSCLKRRVYR